MDALTVCIVVIICAGLLLRLAIRAVFSACASKGAQLGDSAARYARSMLDDLGMQAIAIFANGKGLGSYYDKERAAVCLSEAVYSSRSAAAAAVACHECGHVIQTAAQIRAFAEKGKLAKVTEIAASLWFVVFVLGTVAGVSALRVTGVALLVIAFVLQIVSLPSEYDASRRALTYLDKCLCDCSLHDQALRNARLTLATACLTYLASILTGVVPPVELLSGLFDD